MLDTSAWNKSFQHANSSYLAGDILGADWGYPGIRDYMKQFEDGNRYYIDVNGKTTLIGQHSESIAPIVSGTDGLHQYTWQAIYSMVINAGLKSCNAKAYYILRGDDARVCGVFDERMSDAEVMAEMTNIRNSLLNYLEGFGFKINISESYISRDLFSFNKTLMFRTIKLAQFLKLGGKIRATQDVVIPNFEEFVGNIYSAGYSSAGVDVHPSSAFIVTIVQACALVKEKRPKLLNRESVTLFSWNCELGGYPAKC